MSIKKKHKDYSNKENLEQLAIEYERRDLSVTDMDKENSKTYDAISILKREGWGGVYLTMSFIDPKLYML